MEQEVTADFCLLCFSCIYINAELFSSWNQYFFISFWMSHTWSLSRTPHRGVWSLHSLGLFLRSGLIVKLVGFVQVRVMGKSIKRWDTWMAILSAYFLMLTLYRFRRMLLFFFFFFKIVSWSKTRDFSLSSNHRNIETMITGNSYTSSVLVGAGLCYCWRMQKLSHICILGNVIWQGCHTQRGMNEPYKGLQTSGVGGTPAILERFYSSCCWLKLFLFTANDFMIDSIAKLCPCLNMCFIIQKT